MSEKDKRTAELEESEEVFGVVFPSSAVYRMKLNISECDERCFCRSNGMGRRLCCNGECNA